MEKDNKPKHFLVFKIIGFVGVIVAIVGVVLTAIGFGDFETNNFMIGAIMTCLGLFVGVSCLMAGFGPEIAKLNAKSARYIQEQNKDDLTQMSNTTAEISSEAVTTVTKSVKKGLKDSKYCSQCGAEIDANSKYCNLCGGKQ